MIVERHRHLAGEAFIEATRMATAALLAFKADHPEAGERYLNAAEAARKRVRLHLDLADYQRRVKEHNR